MYSLPNEVTPSSSPRPYYSSSSNSPAPSPNAFGFSAAEEKGAKVAGAVFGTLGGLVAVAAAIVFFAPTATVMGVVPADVIKSGASAAWSGAKAASSAVYAGFSSLAGTPTHASIGATAYTSASAGASNVSPRIPGVTPSGGEKTGLLSAGRS